MDHSLAMRLVEGFRDLNAVLENLLQGQRAAPKAVGHGLALQVFHYQVLETVLGAHIVERADVRMVQHGNRPGLTFETLARGGAIDASGENLDGDDAVETRVAGLIHVPHPTGAD